MSNLTFSQDNLRINSPDTTIIKTSQKSIDNNKVEVTLDKDLISFVKSVFWIAGIFLALISFIGIAFFGFDVRNAKKNINDTINEIRNTVNEAQQIFTEVKEKQTQIEEKRKLFESYVDQAKETIEQIGAQVETLAEEEVPKISRSENIRDDAELIKDIIKSGSFDWTTIGRIIRKSGLSRDEILKIARSQPEIIIGYGVKSKDHIFKLKNNGGA